MGCFDYNRAGQLNLQFMLTWKMAHTENLYARHRFELIMLILWFYFTIWLGLQMKSQSHPLQELCCERRAPAAHRGVPACFPPLLRSQGCVWAAVGGGPLSCTHCRAIAGCRHKPAYLSAEMMGCRCVLSSSKMGKPQLSLIHSFLLLLTHQPGSLVFFVFQLHGIRLLFNINSIWKTNQKIWFLRWGYFLTSGYENIPSHTAFCIN